MKAPNNYMSNFFLNLISRPDPIFFLIAGPCVIEDYKTTFTVAKHLKQITAKLDIPFIFKASFDKANRTSIQSFRGPGFDKGLEVLDSIKKELAIDVGETTQDNVFSLEIARCFGACGLAPAIMINDDVHQRVKPARIKQILAPYKKSELEVA